MDKGREPIARVTHSRDSTTFFNDICKFVSNIHDFFHTTLFEKKNWTQLTKHTDLSEWQRTCTLCLLMLLL